MNDAEEQLRKYLVALFPATVGNIELSNLIDALAAECRTEGLRDAAEIAMGISCDDNNAHRSPALGDCIYRAILAGD